MQSFFKTLNFEKQFFYKPPSDLYQEFSNAYAYYKQATLSNTTPDRQELLKEARAAWKQIKKQDEIIIREKIQTYFATLPRLIQFHHSLLISAPVAVSTSASASASTSTETSLQISNKTNIIPNNAIGQQNAIAKIKETTQQLHEYEQSYLHI